MASDAWMNLAPEITSGYVASGVGTGTWESARSTIEQKKAELEQANQSTSSAVATNEAGSKGLTTAARTEALNKTKDWITTASETLDKHAKAADEMIGAYGALKSSVVPLDTVVANRFEYKTLEPFAIIDPTVPAKLAQLEAEYQSFRSKNNAAFGVYDVRVNSAMSTLEDSKLKSEKVPTAEAGGGGSFASAVQQLAAGVSQAMSGVTGGTGSGSGSFSPATHNAGTRAGGGGHLDYEINKVNPDDIYNRLKDFTGGSGFSPNTYNPDFSSTSEFKPRQLGEYSPTTSTSAFKSGYTPGQYTPSEFKSSDFKTGLSSYTPGSSSYSTGGAGGAGALGAYAGRSSSNFPSNRFPGGASAMGRLASGDAASNGFRGTGASGVRAGATGGLGLAPARGTASPSQVFGGVKNTPTQAASARGPMGAGMMPGAARGQNKKSGSGKSSDTKAYDNGIYNDVAAFTPAKKEN